MTTRYRPVPTSPQVVADAMGLRRRYDEAQQRSDHTGTDWDYLAAEQAWDALIDYVEANDLNYTKHDPRGPEDTDPATDNEERA